MPLALFLACALAAEPAAAVDPCADPAAPQQVMNSCAHQDWQAADVLLNEAYQSIRAELDEEARGKLRDAQRAWVAFRDAECTWRADLMRGGSAEPLLLHGCKAELTRARTKELEEARNP